MINKKEYNRLYMRNWRAEHKNYHKTYYTYEKGKKNYLHTTYQMTLEEYNTKFQEQNGLCAVCKKHQSNFKRSLAVDHDHITGKIRGLLCFGCNISLGHMQDNTQWLQNAIDYIKRGGR